MTALVALVLVLVGFHSVAASTDAGGSFRGFGAAKTDNVHPTSIRGRSGTSAHSVPATNRGTHECTLSQRVESGFKRTGTVMRQEELSCTLSCLEMCEKVVTGCQGVNYETRTHICYFLSEPGYVTANRGFISASISLASFVNWCLAPNFILGHKRVTEPMENTPFASTSAQDCCISCYTTPKCIAFDFNVDSGDCSLSESEGKISELADSSTGLVCVT